MGTKDDHFAGSIGGDAVNVSASPNEGYDSARTGTIGQRDSFPEVKVTDSEGQPHVNLACPEPSDERQRENLVMGSFLRAIYGHIGAGEQIELRTRNATEGMRASFHVSFEDVIHNGLSCRGTHDVFFGVATRDGQGGKKANLMRIPCVWADLDSKDGATMEEMKGRLQTAKLPPSIVVASGRGLHAYWLLSDPAGKESIPEVEALNRLIAKSLKSDLKVCDASRILRLPVTLNYKYDPPLPVELLRLDTERRFSMQELRTAFESPVDSPKRAQASFGSFDIPSRKLPCRREMWNGVDEGGRNVACLYLALDLKGLGWTEDSATKKLLEWNEQNDPPLVESEVTVTVASAFRHGYRGLGCEKEPMRDLCSDECPIALNGPITDAGPPVEPSMVLTFRSWSDLLNGDFGSPGYVAEGIIPNRGVTLITGEGGVGKSFVILDLACAVGSGGKFLHQFACARGPVLLLDLENDDAMLASRARKITAGRREVETIPDDIPVHLLKKDDLSFSNIRIGSKAWQAAIVEAIRLYKPCLIAIDPLSASHDQDENDNQAMRQIIICLQEIAREYNLAIVVVHHPRKRGAHDNDAGQMIRGASDLRNAVDSHLFLRRQSEGVVMVEHDKSRHALPVPKFRFCISDNEKGTASYIRSVAAEDHCVVPIPQSKEVMAARTILIALQAHSPLTFREIAQACKDFSEGTIRRGLKILIIDQKVERINRGAYVLLRSEVASSESLPEDPFVDSL